MTRGGTVHTVFMQIKIESNLFCPRAIGRGAATCGLFPYGGFLGSPVAKFFERFGRVGGAGEGELLQKFPFPRKNKIRQYCLPQMTICFAGLPQQTQVSPRRSSVKGMQRDFTPPVISLSSSSQAVSPHHIALM